MSSVRCNTKKELETVLTKMEEEGKRWCFDELPTNHRVDVFPCDIIDRINVLCWSSDGLDIHKKHMTANEYLHGKSKPIRKKRFNPFSIRELLRI